MEEARREGSAWVAGLEQVEWRGVARAQLVSPLLAPLPHHAMTLSASHGTARLVRHCCLTALPDASRWAHSATSASFHMAPAPLQAARRAGAMRAISNPSNSLIFAARMPSSSINGRACLA